LLTEKEITELLIRSDHAVERGVVAIYRRQTEAEKNRPVDLEHNKIGFNSFDAQRGTYWAKWILSGRKLTKYHLKKARRMIIKYRLQLLDIALTKGKEDGDN